MALDRPDAELDLRGTPCPLNFVRTKLKLEKMSVGSLLEVWLDPGEPIEQVPESLQVEGYCVERIESRGEFYAIAVRVPATAQP
ncbi:MAG: sulfurtransferase TusA family protein [Cyanobacteria bacterium J06641_5]